MKPKLTTRILRYLLIASVIIALAYTLIWTVLQGYSFPWTGFADFTKPNSDFVRGKTLWDWLQLFIIPIFLSIGVFLLNRSERDGERQRSEERTKLEREIATDRQQEAALQSYLDRMADLLLKEKLRTTKKKEARDVANIRTLTILRGLDERRKRIVLIFLYEAELISKRAPIVNLGGTNFSDVNLEYFKLTDANLKLADMRNTNLKKAHLEGANLYFIHLGSANLQDAHLQRANLQNALMHYAKLQNTNLQGAKLKDAKLQYADLTGADLSGADFSGADLTSSIVTSEQLATTKSLKGTIMPDGTKHD